jgi:chromosome segregation ATPase
VSEEKDSELKKDESSIKDANSNNLRLSQTVSADKLELKKKLTELEEKDREIKTMHDKLSAA